MTSRVLPLIASAPRAAALQAHHQQHRPAAPAQVVRGRSHARRAPDRSRPPESISITPRTASPTRRCQLLVQLAEESRPARAHRRDVRADEHINVTEDRAVLHTALRAPGGATDSAWTARTSCRQVHAVLDKMERLLRRASVAASGKATPGKPHSQRRQHRHRRLGSRPGDGLRSARALQRARA